jgi:hypothetical protein
MIINNQKLYNNRCKNCAYREGKNCNKQAWVIPQGDICISYLNKNCSHLIKKSENKKTLNINSSWSEIIQEEYDEEEVFEYITIELSNPNTGEEGYLDIDVFNSIIFVAIDKKSREFYNMIPVFLYGCSCGNYYFNSYCPYCDNGDLEKIEFDISYLGNLIEKFLQDLDLLSVDKILKRIRNLDIEDINIYER